MANRFNSLPLGMTSPDDVRRLSSGLERFVIRVCVIVMWEPSRTAKPRRNYPRLKKLWAAWIEVLLSLFGLVFNQFESAPGSRFVMLG